MLEIGIMRRLMAAQRLLNGTDAVPAQYLGRFFMPLFFSL